MVLLGLPGSRHLEATREHLPPRPQWLKPRMQRGSRVHWPRGEGAPAGGKAAPRAVVADATSTGTTTLPPLKQKQAKAAAASVPRTSAAARGRASPSADEDGE